MEILFLFTSICFAIAMLYYKWQNEQNKKPYIEVSLNEMLTIAREEIEDIDKLGLNTSQITQTVDLNNIDSTGLVIYRQWLYGEFSKVKKIIRQKRR